MPTHPPPSPRYHYRYRYCYHYHYHYHYHYSDLVTIVCLTAIAMMVEGTLLFFQLRCSRRCSSRRSTAVVMIVFFLPFFPSITLTLAAVIRLLKQYQ